MKVCITLVDQSFERTSSIGIFNASLGIAKGLSQLPDVTELVVLTHGKLALPELSPMANTGNVNIVPVREDPPAGWQRVVWDQVNVVSAVNRHEPDWVLFPKGLPPLWRWPKARVCSYVHDNIFGFYATHGGSNRSRFENWYFPTSTKRAARHSDLVVTNSNFTAEEVRSLGRSGATERVGIGFEEPAPRQTSDGGSSIMLLVSPHPHKLSRQAIDWIARWRTSRGSDMPVHGIGSLGKDAVWPGDPGWKLSPRLSQPEFETSWQQARVFLYFSAYEGFGMPPIEASVRGVRTLASDLPPHRENLPPSLLFDNSSWEDFAAKMDAILAAPSDALFRAGTESWDVVAKRIVAAMMRAEPRHRPRLQ